MFERWLSRRTLLALVIIGIIYFLTTLSDGQDILSPRLLTRLGHPPPLEDDNSYREQLALVRPSDRLPHSRTLGLADAIIVISLLRRQDRRDTMDSIASALDLDFTYLDGTDFKTPSGRKTIDRLHDRALWQRTRIDDREALPSDWPTPDNTSSGTYVLNAFPFKWSADTEKNKGDPLAEPLGISGADYWGMDPPDEAWELANPLPDWSDEKHKIKVMEASRLNNQNRKRWVTDAGYACYHSHERALKEIVRRKLNAAIIFEDDIDIEWNIENTLRKQWPSLPNDWDIVYLGHCWSEEWRGEMLPGAPMLRKSFHNLCNHGYVVSQAGAARILRYLRSPDYAYSRPIDHAYKDLVQMGMIKSFSVYPPVAVQTKATISDLIGTIEKVWQKKEGLVDSTLERISLHKNLTTKSV